MIIIIRRLTRTDIPMDTVTPPLFITRGESITRCTATRSVTLITGTDTMGRGSCITLMAAMADTASFGQVTAAPASSAVVESTGSDKSVLLINAHGAPVT